MKQKSRYKGAPDWTDADYLEYWKSRSIVNEQGCWLWQGFVFYNGYGSGSYRGKRGRLHRFAYQAHRGGIPAPAGWDICHTCDNPGCVNPLHLFAADRKTNVRDMLAKGRGNNQRKTHCVHGHEFSEENTYLDRNGYRHCRTCTDLYHRSASHVEWRREYQRRRRAEKRAANTSGDQP